MVLKSDYLKVQYSKTDLENMEIIHNKIIDKISMYDCEEIGKKCQSLAIEVFSKDKILEYYKDLLNYYSTFYDKSNQEFNKDLMYSIKHIDKRKMIHLLNQLNNK